MATGWQINVDTGGTFTDCIAIDQEGKRSLIKVLSSGMLGARLESIHDQHSFELVLPITAYDNLFQGYYIKMPGHDWQGEIISNKGSLFKFDTSLPEQVGQSALVYLTANEEAPVLAARIATKTPLSQSLPEIDFRLGTTRGTNALLEHKGSKTALLVTRGFRDLLEIGTQQRPDLFALNIKKREVIPDDIIEVDEVISAAGAVVQPLSANELGRIISVLKGIGSRSVAIALKNSYLNPVHEEQLAEALKSELNLPVTASAALYPAIKYLTRTETAVVNAYLAPIMEEYLGNIAVQVDKEKMRVMTSSGALSRLSSFNPKDSLLSGPAGGIVGAANAAAAVGFEQVLTIDMGGTSTDVSRYDNGFDYVAELEVGDAHLFTKALAIETVAAGGGSICHLDEGRLKVGPDSAGAFPGPACYGNGGPLAVTDLNLLTGRVDPETFGFPLNIKDAKTRFAAIFRELKAIHPDTEEDSLLSGFLAIANQKMADAVKKISINKGFDPKEYSLLGFGGAVGQHICDIAELLGTSRILVPYEGSLLSAAGIGAANVEKSVVRQILRPLKQKAELLADITEITKEALKQLRKDGINQAKTSSITANLRLLGQDTTLEIEFNDYNSLATTFRNKYEALFGHWVERDIEVESIMATAQSTEKPTNSQTKATVNFEPLISEGKRQILFGSRWHETPNFSWTENSAANAPIPGPAVFTNPFTSIIINPGWQVEIKEGNLVITKAEAGEQVTSANIAAVDLALYTNRFKSVAEQMGSLLQRTALSVNIKERLDFSCALLDKHGRLVVNAPHIPVHLGSLGICTRSVISTLPMKAGDVVITNHPAYGGSHLPDVTLIAPVYAEDTLIGYVANRAHHAEIGGKAPGSMPADAANLAEEGVVIPPTYLRKDGQVQWEQIRELLRSSPYPSRAIEDNIADFQAALASIVEGQNALLKLVAQFGAHEVIDFMAKLSNLATSRLNDKLSSLSKNSWQATEQLDHGAEIKVTISWQDKLKIDFSGSSATGSGNLNATEAIVNGAVIYVLKLLIQGDIPLNEGLMQEVELKIPEGCLLNPHFPPNPEDCPAVVGGNTEVSQRLVDTLLKAFGLAACSQGTMNNFLFGNENYGYYETICGGTGAGNGFNGTDAVHQHMTNTQITDPEILEFRYPVELKEFSIRPKSGGAGQWHGGNGIIRRLRFKEPATVTFLTQHRKLPPYGLDGGQAGKVGQQFLINKQGKIALEGVGTYIVEGEDIIEIKTPGGGGYGTASPID